MELQQMLNTIKELDPDQMKAAQDRLDSLSKPLGSLGRLEEFAVRLAGITGELYPRIDRKAVVIMCSDNGVVDEGVAQVSRSVTAAVTRNFLKGITGINVLSTHAGAETVIVDMGVEDDLDLEGICRRKIRKCTWNIARGPAMTREEAVKAIETGIELVGDLKRRGYNLLGTGEMGIGNTTTSSAIAAVLTGKPVESVVGKGAGLSSEGLANKIRVVSQAIAINRPDPQDALDVLAKLGGFDIAGLAGCFIGAAVFRMPIVMDGFITAVAALLAVRMHSGVRSFIFPSHGSAEPGNKAVMEMLGFEPILNLSMRLGEGTGAALAFHILDAAVAAYTSMGTFADAEIKQYEPLA